MNNIDIWFSWLVGDIEKDEDETDKEFKERIEEKNEEILSEIQEITYDGS